MVENATENVSQTIRAVNDVVTDALGIESPASVVETVLEPLASEVVVAYTRAHFTAEGF
ncbi:hypothetical protein [Nocardia rhizosphaerae]|uniref:Mutator family transposase n=1 Tax=Nocardia rhizosphaerae TaxID=1691571 RepID=A0ABV8LDS6_9NOCA